MRAVITTLAAVALLLGTSAAVADAGSWSSDKKCAPGQHGNGHPGFKPGSCK